MCMLAICGIVVQESGIHFPGAAYENPDIFGAVGTAGWPVNLQIFLAIGAAEIATFNMHYGDGEPGDFGIDGGMLKGMSAAQLKTRKEQEIV
jgi:Chlorophyll A-B binding protein